jgi:hypothetical protein
VRESVQVNNARRLPAITGPRSEPVRVVDQTAGTELAGGHPGANSRPWLTAAANHHTGTAPTIPPTACGQRDRAATAAPAIADTASATGHPATAGTTGSGATSTNNAVNTTRSHPARPRKRRNQPRTVSTGRPTNNAARLAPAPPAAATNARPITSTTSARRTNAINGSNTCDDPHARHRDRRGRSTTAAAPLTSRSRRVRAHPHGPNRP